MRSELVVFTTMSGTPTSAWSHRRAPTWAGSATSTAARLVTRGAAWPWPPRRPRPGRRPPPGRPVRRTPALSPRRYPNRRWSLTARRPAERGVHSRRIEDRPWRVFKAQGTGPVVSLHAAAAVVSLWQMDVIGGALGPPRRRASQRRRRARHHRRRHDGVAVSHRNGAGVAGIPRLATPHRGGADRGGRVAVHGGRRHGVAQGQLPRVWRPVSWWWRRRSPRSCCSAGGRSSGWPLRRRSGV